MLLRFCAIPSGKSPLPRCSRYFLSRVGTNPLNFCGHISEIYFSLCLPSQLRALPDNCIPASNTRSSDLLRPIIEVEPSLFPSHAAQTLRNRLDYNLGESRPVQSMPIYRLTPPWEMSAVRLRGRPIAITRRQWFRTRLPMAPSHNYTHHETHAMEEVFASHEACML